MAVVVQLDELFEAMQRRGAPLTPESVYFIALQAIESMREQLMVIDPAGVEIDTDGVVHLNELCSPAGDDPEAVRGVIETLATLLVPAPMGLDDLRERVELGDVVTRGALQAELSALLVPFNRGAAQRMLGRLAREATRDETLGPTVDGDKDTLLTNSKKALTEDKQEKQTTVGHRESPIIEDNSSAESDPEAYTLDGGATQPDGAIRDDWEPTTRRKGPSPTLTAITVVIAVVSLLGAVWFLYTRLRG